MGPTFCPFQDAPFMDKRGKTNTDYPDSRHWGAWDKPHLFNPPAHLCGQPTSSLEQEPSSLKEGRLNLGVFSHSSSFGHWPHKQKVKMLLWVKRTTSRTQTCQYESVSLKKPGKSFGKCSSESPWGIMVPHVSPPSPLPGASPSQHERMWMEVFFSLPLVKLWSIQQILVYQPYRNLKRACQFIINSSNYIIAVKRHVRLGMYCSYG